MSIHVYSTMTLELKDTFYHNKLRLESGFKKYARGQIIRFKIPIDDDKFSVCVGSTPWNLIHDYALNELTELQMKELYIEYLNKYNV